MVFLRGTRFHRLLILGASSLIADHKSLWWYGTETNSGISENRLKFGKTALIDLFQHILRVG